MTKFDREDKITMTVFAVVLLVGVGLFWSAATQARSSVTASYNMVADGGCDKVMHAVSLDIQHEGTNREAHGYVRTAPSGGDCETSAVAYDAGFIQYLPGYWGFEPYASIGLSSQSASAPYALTDESGNVLLRDDGNALHVTNLPVGRAESVEAVVGMSKRISLGQREDAELQARLGVLLAPVDWADGKSTHGAILELDTEVFGLNVNTSTVVGADVYGDIAVRWSRGPVVLTYRLAYGLDALAPPGPQVAVVSGTPFALAGVPQSTAHNFEIGLRWEL